MSRQDVSVGLTRCSVIVAQADMSLRARFTQGSACGHAVSADRPGLAARCWDQKPHAQGRDEPQSVVDGGQTVVGGRPSPFSVSFLFHTESLRGGCREDRSSNMVSANGSFAAEECIERLWLGRRCPCRRCLCCHRERGCVCNVRPSGVCQPSSTMGLSCSACWRDEGGHVLGGGGQMLGGDGQVLGGDDGHEAAVDPRRAAGLAAEQRARKAGAQTRSQLARSLILTPGQRTRSQSPTSCSSSSRQRSRATGGEVSLVLPCSHSLFAVGLKRGFIERIAVCSLLLLLLPFPLGPGLLWPSNITQGQRTPGDSRGRDTLISCCRSQS